jgi:glycosyltransferase involved in cell wall biosynthesis
MAARISCIIPAYNSEAFIHRSLRSVLDQTHPPNEIVVVDDGSVDATPKILASYGDLVHVIRQENSGPAAARNAGIKAATGELICFQDADDEWHPDKIARQISLLSSRSNADGCITHIRNVWSPEAVSAQHALTGHPVTESPPGYVFQTLLTHRAVFEKVGLLNEQLRTAEDVEWYGRARDAGVAIAIVPDVLVYRHLHGDNVSEQVTSTASARYDDLLDVISARLKSRQPA